MLVHWDKMVCSTVQMCVGFFCCLFSVAFSPIQGLGNNHYWWKQKLSALCEIPEEKINDHVLLLKLKHALYARMLPSKITCSHLV